MNHNLLFDLDQTLLDFHASERIALKAVMEKMHQTFTEDHYAFFKQCNKKLWLEFEKGAISNCLKQGSDAYLKSTAAIRTAWISLK